MTISSSSSCPPAPYQQKIIFLVLAHAPCWTHNSRYFMSLCAVLFIPDRIACSCRWPNTLKTLSTLPRWPLKPRDMKVRSSLSFITLLIRFAEMVEILKHVTSSSETLTFEERGLLSIAYKNVISARRASWRTLHSIERWEEVEGNKARVSIIQNYRKKIESELTKICEDLIAILHERLIPSADSEECKAFYHKMWVALLQY